MSQRLAASIDAINAVVVNTTDESHLLIAAKCRALMAGYDARWGHLEYEVTAVEQFVESDLWNPATGKKSRTFRVAGKLDVIGSYDGRRVLIDHKTCSQDIADADAPYWRQLTVEGQVNHYMLLEWLNGRKVDSAVWDVVRKPGISPKALSKKDLTDVTMLRRYCGRQLSDETIATLQATGRETPEMYEARLAEDCITERPNWYFQRRTIPRMDHEISEYASELWDHGQELLNVRNTGRHVRNSGACMNYGTPCKFLGICSGHDSEDSANWRKRPTVHNELPIVNGDGRDILTNSRIRSYQTCRRKHFYEYELGIERVNEEEKESLYFGTLYHVGQEAWWKFGMSTNEAAFIGQPTETRSETCLA